ncbi:hypothetical protein [Pseudoxanthomonas sp. PXM02]|uniref:hypothetical protein n=1 Tax=Pseudoxanthomonas sp. PXM02 TaxID=2769294 RepID=UPI00177B5096|nr:hypothetical protein [Pseudoxanthomonas sp. PXM02]MBD9480133.1 hypothetical protein [Pseudoxanthomonas sp. PXM02]
MVTPRDLQGVDAAWLAIDAIGQVAIFTTGGEGPIPTTALVSAHAVEELVLSLPEVSSVDLLVTLSRPDDFVTLSKRGLFAYDWSDVHRTTRQYLGGYELQSRPKTPLGLSDLPGPLRALAAATQLSGVMFGTSIVVPGNLVGT